MNIFNQIRNKRGIQYDSKGKSSTLYTVHTLIQDVNKKKGVNRE